MADDEKEQKRRPRRSYNCGPCKKQKIKCDTAIPCGACRRHNRVEQCLASPPNPPSLDRAKRVRKQSLSSFGNENSLSDFRTANTQRPAVQLQPPQTFQPKVDHSTVKLPSIHTYTTTFKVSDKYPHSYTHNTSGHVDPVPAASSVPWDTKNGQQQPAPPPPPSTSLHRSAFGPPSDQATPQSRDAEILKLQNQVSVLTERLAQLEAKVSATSSPTETTHTLPARKNQAEKTSQIRTFNDFLSSLPESHILQGSINFFKKYLNKPLEIIDDKVIDGRLASLRPREEGPTPSHDDWENLSLIAIVMSLTVLHYPKNKIEQDLRLGTDVVQVANSLLQVSKSALGMVKYKENPKLIHLQILLLYDISLRFFNKKNLIMAMGSELVSMAYVLGLQTHKIPQNALEIDVPQKVWWIICHNDTLNSLKFGFPPLIRLESIPKEQVGSSQILKAFISAELNTTYQTLLTHIAKLTKICNEVPTSMGASLVEYLETLIMIDRQLTSYNIPQSLSILNPRNDIIINFQCCYLHFFIVLNRLRIYRKIYFGCPDDGIWFIMLSILESFLKRYNELRQMYPPEEYMNHYHQLSDCLVFGTIMYLIMVTTEPTKLPNGLNEILGQYSTSIIIDMSFFRRTIFNEKVPFFQRSFETLDMLMSHMQQQTSTSTSTEELQLRQRELTVELQKSRVFDSHESTAGLVPSNDFFNVYFGNIAHHRRNVTIAAHSWKLDGVLGQEQLEFLLCLGA
ncbi:CYFA0S07e00936g1_1 [Cyberlindnera fabianii]|uniref:CYFA0S07e00936g1_1 n=1 Tax=Cyberlindnera fabianii TaxID=36022 RepID=A0A061AUM7_CYBFA|nr:CYFA0S07e00936g1_1 [Cyberlindnera fabianii]